MAEAIPISPITDEETEYAEEASQEQIPASSHEELFKRLSETLVLPEDEGPFYSNYYDDESYGKSTYSMPGEDHYYKPTKTDYVSGLARFAWMKSAPTTEIEETTRLTSSMIQHGLSCIGRAVDSTEMAYLKFEARSKSIGNIDKLSRCKHVRNVDLSDNSISSLLALASMKHLQVLNVEKNLIKSFQDIPHFIWLQALNLKSNDIQTLEGIQPNYLTYLKLSNNNISSVDYFTGNIFPNLLLLELRSNRISSIAGIELPKLRHLYIAQNMLLDLDGLEECPNLEHLNARENQISTLVHFPNLEKLKYINLRNNKIRRFTQTVYLGKSENLETVILLENPIFNSERYRAEILAAVLSIKRLDKAQISEIERIDGLRLRSERVMNIIPPLEDDYTITSPIPSKHELLGEEQEGG